VQDKRTACRPAVRLLFFLLLCSVAPRSVRCQVKPVRRVLIINEVGVAWPGINLIDDGIREALGTFPYESEVPYELQVYREYMDSILFPDPAHQQRFREFYTWKYQNHRPDVIITVGPSPLKFMVETHDRAFPGVPIVFCYPNWVPDSPTLDSDFTGVENALGHLKPLRRLCVFVPAQGTSLWSRGHRSTIRNS
jgi:hypothetical protein